MPDIVKQEAKTTLKRFLRKKLLYYIIPNIFFNTLIAYASFAKLGYAYLFAGEQNLARLTLPMSLFIPFIITFDILKKTILLSEQGAIDLAVDDNLNKNKFIFQMATIHGLCVLLFVLALMFGVQLNLPEHYSFNGTLLAFLDGLLAGLYSVIFTYLPIKKLKKYMFKQTEVPVSA
ncbi:hypothetical protein [Mucilaginibacter lappiensis]|uniref:hypothetical protein n=1 Tax=Mucilaginibacter lappiensis TaxID=354630 RepID=UPI003D25752C